MESLSRNLIPNCRRLRESSAGRKTDWEVRTMPRAHEEDLPQHQRHRCASRKHLMVLNPPVLRKHWRHRNAPDGIHLKGRFNSKPSFSKEPSNPALVLICGKEPPVQICIEGIPGSLHGNRAVHALCLHTGRAVHNDFCII